MNKEKENYLKTICNFLNNTEGYIDMLQVKFLLEYIKEKRFEITSENLEEISNLASNLSDYVENDNQEEFIKVINEFKGEF